MKAIALPLIALGVSIAACGPSNQSTSQPDTMVAVTVATPAAAAPFYEVLGTHAENAYDAIKLANWNAARVSVDSLVNALGSVQAQDTTGQSKEILASVSRLDSAVTNHAQIAGEREANRLTQLGAILASGHNTVVPASVTLLDYYGRELEIWSAANQPAKLSATASAISKTWNQLRPQVATRGGTAAAAQFDKAVASVVASRTPKQYAANATPLLNEVDALEAVFVKK